MTLEQRAFRVAVSGVVPDDDPSIIADMVLLIEQYEKAMSWMRDQDPQMVDAAIERFKLREI